MCQNLNLCSWLNQARDIFRKVKNFTTFQSWKQLSRAPQGSIILPKSKQTRNCLYSLSSKTLWCTETNAIEESKGLIELSKQTIICYQNHQTPPYLFLQTFLLSVGFHPCFLLRFCLFQSLLLFSEYLGLGLGKEGWTREKKVQNTW